MPPKQKADTAGISAAEKGSGRGRAGRLYLFHGEETYLRDHYLGRLKELLLTGGMGEFNLHTIPAQGDVPPPPGGGGGLPAHDGAPDPGAGTGFRPVQGGAEGPGGVCTGPLPSSRTTCCLVFVYDLIPYKGDARTKLAAAIKQNGTVVNFARQDQGDLVDWVRRRFRALGKEIDTRTGLRFDLPVRGPDDKSDWGDRARSGHMPRAGGSPGRTSTRWPPPSWTRWCSSMTDAIGEGNFDRAASVLGELYQMQEPPITHHVVSGPADAPALLRPAGHREGGRGPPMWRGCGGCKRLPGGQADDLGPPVLPELVPAGGGPLRPDGPGHEVHRSRTPRSC